MSINFKSNNIELNYNNRLMLNNIENCPNKVVKELSEASDVISNYAQSKKSQIWVKPEEVKLYVWTGQSDLFSLKIKKVNTLWAYGTLPRGL